MQNAEKPMIVVKHLTVKYNERTILKDVSFDVKKGEVFVIVGGSGCGKTTLLNQMIGLFEPDQGEIWIHGENIATTQGLAKQMILRHIGVMFQSGALFGSMTLLQNVMLPLEEWTDLPLAAREAIALNKLKLVGLGDFATFYPAQLSGGMQKRAAIARAMALDPEILFLDEPSAGLDPITSANIDELILNLKEVLGMTFVVVTHELASIDAIADHLVMLQNGQIIASGTLLQMKANTTHDYVQQFFHRISQEVADHAK